MPVWNFCAMPADEDFAYSDDTDEKRRQLDVARTALTKLNGVTVNGEFFVNCSLSLTLLTEDVHGECRRVLAEMQWILDDGKGPNAQAGKSVRGIF
ncbi:MAG TPA: hypothetical protein VJB60_02585 [Candidatus Peribacterales bacterium]|nr:hypothetical protein [Candidatus Peribacterales bacterium]